VVRSLHSQSSARIIAVTKPIIDEIPSTDDLISYAARVSNPANQLNTETSDKLLAYCVRNQHWSVFEMANVVMEIKCTRDIARQILRHRSFSFQEFSQRYAEATGFTVKETRLQDSKNRQSSLETSDRELMELWEEKQKELLRNTESIYKWALSNGIAKEVARVVLPEGLTMSTMYMNGTVRSWIHYIKLRTEAGTQKEHREVAEQCKLLLLEQFPFLKEVFEG
jgi:thymidylate synthase (FAD)